MTPEQAGKLCPGDLVEVFEDHDTGRQWWRAKVAKMVHRRRRDGVLVIKARRQWYGPAHHANDGYVATAKTYPLDHVRSLSN